MPGSVGATRQNMMTSKPDKDTKKTDHFAHAGSIPATIATTARTRKQSPPARRAPRVRRERTFSGASSFMSRREFAHSTVARFYPVVKAGEFEEDGFELRVVVGFLQLVLRPAELRGH